MIQHKELYNGRWNEMSLAKQLANIGSEVSRTENGERKITKNNHKKHLKEH
jgi:hypothetical protein